MSGILRVDNTVQGGVDRGDCAGQCLVRRQEESLAESNLQKEEDRGGDLFEDSWELNRREREKSPSASVGGEGFGFIWAGMFI